MFLGMFVFFVVSVVSSIFLRGPRKLQKRARLISEYARQKGYRLANPAAVEAAASSSSWREMLANPALRSLSRGSEGIADIGDFGSASDDSVAVICSLGSKDVTVLGLSVWTRRADGRNDTIHYKVAKVKVPGLPSFSLGRNSWVHTVETAVDKLTGKPKSSIDMDPSADPEFARHYWVNGPDRGGVLAFLSPEKLRFLGSTKLAGVVAANGNYFVYFEYGTLNSAKDFDSFIPTVENLVTHLL
jgi:hypothetical protein